MTESTLSDIAKELEQARDRLLDLTMRNRMLNFRPTKLSTIRVVDERPCEIYDRLVLKEHLMKFQAKPEEKRSPKGLSPGEPQGEQDDESWNFDTSKIPKEHTDRFLQTELTVSELERRLKSIYQRSFTVFEEQGYTVSFLSLGFLEWKESPDSEELRKAPLILIPVEIERKRVATAYTIKWTGEDIYTNVSLQSKLAEQGISLPEFEMPESKEAIDTYAKRIGNLIPRQKAWRITQGIYLGFFSFTKFVMHRDLNPDSWPPGKQPASHPLIRSLFVPDEKVAEGEDFFQDERKISQLSIRNQFLVMDADASQVAVIEAVKAGRNLVVEGPPGTGKSQTITNLIAELLSHEKSVLFVSEKMAALEVVKKRLVLCGLGEACLELHSRYTKKRAFLNEIKSAIEATHEGVRSLTEDFEEHDRLSHVLNSYVNAIKQPLILDRSPYEFLGIRERIQSFFDKRSKSLIRVPIGSPESWSSEKYNEIIAHLRDLSETLPVVSPLHLHAWRACAPEAHNQFDVDEIIEIISMFLAELGKLETRLKQLDAWSATGHPDTQKGTEAAIKAGHLMARGLPIPRKVLMNIEWDDFSPIAAQLIKHIQTVQDTKTYFVSILSSDVHTFDFKSLVYRIDTLQEEFRSLTDQLKDLERLCATGDHVDLKHADTSLIAARIIAESKPIESEVLRNSAWNKKNTEAEHLIESVKHLQVELKDLSSFMSQQAFTPEIHELHVQLSEKSQGVFRYFSPEFWRLKKSARGFYTDTTKRSVSVMLGDFNRLVLCLNLRDDVAKREDEGYRLFGRYWKGEKSHIDDLEFLATWIVSFRQYLIQGHLTKHAVELVESGIDLIQVMDAIRGLEAQRKTIDTLLRNFVVAIGIDLNTVFTETIHISFSEWESRLRSWKDSITRLARWSHWMIEEQGTGPPTSKPLLEAFYRSSPSSVLSQFEVDSEKIRTGLKLIDEIQANNDNGKALFGSYWQAEYSAPSRLQEIGEWIVVFRNMLSKGHLSDKALEIAEQKDERTNITDAVQAVQTQLNQITECYKTLTTRLKFDHTVAFSHKPPLVSFTDWKRLIQQWLDNRHKLLDWAQWISIKDTATSTNAAPLIPLIEEGRFTPDEVIPTFEGNIAEAALKLAFTQRPELGNFMGKVHEKNILNFKAIDEKIIQLNRRRIAHALYEIRPKISGGVSKDSEVGILSGQINRKRGIMSIRQLMKNVGTLIQKIKPCMMMSPLSVAQFLNPSLKPFDVIIFDEASQVRPEDALGALLRGQQLVVMGDTRQLPPTTFFDRLLLEDTSEEEDEDDMGVTRIVDVESILHQCKRSYPAKMLHWHYRSRHESLIAVSNQEFYDNKMLVYPSSADKISYLGLELKHTPGATYDRGRSSTNRDEAKAVIRAAFEHYREFPEKSLGIGTFSMKQQQAILDEQERMLRVHPEMEDLFSTDRHEHFFVKNLETIQGDERDVIFISVGYGFDQTGGRLKKQFGPLNMEGGERRLNVLITRSRERCVVFSNFRAQDLMTEHTDAFGVRALKIFLDYAENRNLRSITESGADTDAPFEDAVYDFLTTQGHIVRKQVGCAGFRLDLAIVDPDAPGRYILGIECDGAMYYSSPVARDRDRLRHQILENLGWRIHRIWSTDWYRNRPDTRIRLLRAIESSKTTRSPIPNTKKSESIIVSTLQPSEIWNKVEAEALSTPETLSLEDQIPEYTTCHNIGIVQRGELHELWTSKMAEAIVNIVKVEYPVHFDEIIRRLRTAWGLGRAAGRIKSAVKTAIEYAQSNRLIRKQGDFIWITGGTKAAVRRRTENPSPKIEQICKEEISAALIMVLQAQFATQIDDLIRQTARLFGFQAVYKPTARRIKSVIQNHLKTGKFKQRENGMIEVATNS